MKNIFSLLAILGLLASIGFNSDRVYALSCNSIASCAQQQQQLKKQQEEAKQKYEQSRKESATLQEVISDLQADINYTQGRIENTEAQIVTTEKLINELSQGIATSEDDLKEAYSTLYELSRNSSMGILFQSSINDALSQAQYIQSIQSQLQKELGQMKLSKQDRESQKQEMERQKQALEQDRSTLASKKSQQSYLLSTAQKNATYYQGLSADIQKQIAEVEKRISTLIAQASWGSDIVSANNSSWYYSQLNYPSTFLGTSPYTVAQYGCLITSIAMVSTYYGRGVSPVDVATRNENFDGNGYLIRQPPAPISFSSMTTAALSWTTINNELAANRPVIVSIFIPSVGKINSDGSSHFVVLYGRAGGKYLMHDPLGPGRSYAASYVRSMKLIRP